jgi:hypothetical protein
MNIFQSLKNQAGASSRANLPEPETERAAVRHFRRDTKKPN